MEYTLRARRDAASFVLRGRPDQAAMRLTAPGAPLQKKDRKGKHDVTKTA